MATSKLHVAMYPWFAFGHFIPFLHLSNKLAERGLKVSYLLTKGALPKLQQLNHHPHLIRFFPLVIPHVDGLPPGAETASDVPFPLHDLLISAMDKTKDQVETILGNLKPDIVFFDFGRWIPSLTRRLGSMSIYYSVVNACSMAFSMVPAKGLTLETTLDEQIQPPPGYPSTTVIIKRDEAPHIVLVNDPPRAASFCLRLTEILKESDVIALRTGNEIEGPFCDYIAQQYSKPVLLTGPVLPETPATQLEEKWDKWLNKFEAGSVAYCAFGLTPPHGYSTIEEALPEGFKERVGDRGWAHGGWVPQTLILKHPSVGCFVSHCGFGFMWESLVAIEVERGVDWIIGKESLSKSINLVMDKESELGNSVRNNHVKFKSIFSSKDWQDEKIDPRSIISALPERLNVFSRKPLRPPFSDF
ncbi:hypothetical protein Patl1_04742 [Pistacia atlantica]|uniref:Uncharacterized protein n=1 Tax=Pistacia atlantica TaxID=434234 RepID=A0ACC1BTR6_9ROSI|nr:hypothetical protein Patl1_04742 [Pistacia atlantica]